MTTVEYSPPRQRLSWTRRVIGAVVCLTGLIALVLFALDRVTRDSVFLRSHFENYLTGLGGIIVLGVVALIVLTPVRNSAAQNRRMMTRFLLLALAALLFVGAGLTHGFDFFIYQPTIIASSPDGSRHVASVNIGTYRELQVFTGSGLGTKIAGNLGAPCELYSVKFSGNSDILVSTAQGDYDFKLTPDGRPIGALTQQCAGSFQTAPAAPRSAVG
ncbi:MAG TPA: hypothetical protein VFR11_00810 [Micromonosporaceae bacterium]|jgi:hypothetical protein|nr:hypothetical protein [Micromonosporaceae bacterium]